MTSFTLASPPRMALALAQSRIDRSFAPVAAPRARRGRAAARASAAGELSATPGRAARDRDDVVRVDRGLGRRDALVAMTMSASALAMREREAKAEEMMAEVDRASADAIEAPAAVEVKRTLATKRVESETLAYEFEYPIEAESGKPISWAVSRERETYSSAEPMSPNARQRIVYELLSFKGPLTTVVTVSNVPPALEGKDKSEWTARQVANAVLADKATGRVASGQRVSLAEVDNAKKQTMENGDTHYYYEYISQGSPNLREPEATTFRHSYGVTVERGGYLYTLSSSAPEIYWDELSRGFDESVRSFRLTKPTRKYREPGNEGLGISLPFQ